MTKRLLKKEALFVLVFFHLALPVGVMADDSKDAAVSSALKDEAMRSALQEAELKEAEKQEPLVSASSELLKRIHPYASLSFTYDDNIYLIDENVEDDMITTLTPGIKFSLGRLGQTSEVPLPGQNLELDLGGKITEYSDHSQLNREEPYVTLLYSLGKRNNKLMFRQYYRDASTVTSELVTGGRGLVDYTENYTGLNWEVTRNRLGLGLAYTRDSFLYKKDYKSTNSYDDQMIGITGFLQAYPKTRLLLEYDYGTIEYTEASTDENDSKYSIYWLGIEGELTKKTDGLVKFGYEKRDYKGGKQDYAATSVDINLIHRYSPKTTFFFAASQVARESTLATETFDKGYDISLKSLYNFNSRISLEANIISYSYDKYLSGRTDDTYDSSLLLNYMLKEWAKIGFKYSHRERRSSTSGAGYNGNTYTVRADIAF